MRKHYDHKVSLADLTVLTGLNKHYLNETFEAQVGLTPHVYQRHLRLQRAKRLLQVGHPPAQVAYWVGFADQSHLNRHFKRYTGMTTGQYRDHVATKRAEEQE